MVALLTTINNLLDLKLVQWLLLFSICGIMGTLVVICFRYNALRLEHAFLQTEVAKTASALQVQNKAILEASELARKIQDRYDKKASEASKIALQSQKNLQSILDIDFSSECGEAVKQALVLVQKQSL